MHTIAAQFPLRIFSTYGRILEGSVQSGQDRECALSRSGSQRGASVLSQGVAFKGYLGISHMCKEEGSLLTPLDYVVRKT